MKTFKVILNYSDLVEAESQEEAEQFFSDNMDLGKGKLESYEIEDENYCDNPSCVIKNCEIHNEK